MISYPAYFMDRLRATISISALIIGPGFFSVPLPATADGLNTSTEYIVGFFRYVQWQSENQLSAWNVCTVGDFPQDQLRVYADRTARNKPFSIRNINPDAALNDCQALDLTRTNIETAKRILMRSRHMPILTVGSNPEFCSIGGQICLNLNDSSPTRPQKFAVNLSAFKDSKLEISARLLSIGRTTSEDAR